MRFNIPRSGGLTALILLVISATSALAQGYRGHDFWIAFPENAMLEAHHELSLSLFITAEERTSGTIQSMLDTSMRNFSVEGGASEEITIDTAFEIHSTGRFERKALHLTCDHDITLYAVSHRVGSTDSYAAIPTSALGTSYMTAGYTTLPNGPILFTSQSVVVATQNNTLVTIHLTGSTRDGLPKGRAVMIPLDSGQTFQLQGGDDSTGDLTGTSFDATKPIAFFTGHRCAQVPPSARYCDVLLEEEPPERDWGRDFILPKLEGKDFSVARVIAAEDSTLVSVDGHRVAMLSKAAFYECDTLRSDAEIITSKPALVAQYSTSSTADDVRVGDPFMLFIVPKDRFIPEVTVTSLMPSVFHNYLTIVVPKEARSGLRIDGLPVVSTPASFLLQPIHERAAPNSQFDIISLALREGRHLVQCPAPIGVYSYGFGTDEHQFDSYGHACGMRMEH